MFFSYSKRELDSFRFIFGRQEGGIRPVTTLSLWNASFGNKMQTDWVAESSSLFRRYET